MVCHFFNKTFSKLLTFLKKCFLLNLKPTSYLKEICNNDDERRVDKPLKATCPDYLYILFITKKSNSKMNITQWDISFVVAPHFTVTLTINKTLVLYYENNLINMRTCNLSCNHNLISAFLFININRKRFYLQNSFDDILFVFR